MTAALDAGVGHTIAIPECDRPVRYDPAIELATSGQPAQMVGRRAAVTIMSVAQRRSEIGLRRAVGYRRLEVARLIVLEAAGVGLLGGILGASIGVLATAAIASGNHWTPVMNSTLVLTAPLIGIAVGVLAGSYPAMRAARITPVAALRS